MGLVGCAGRPPLLQPRRRTPLRPPANAGAVAAVDCESFAAVCETRQPSSHSAAAVPQAVGVVYCGITAWFAVSWRRRQRYLRSKRHDIDEDAKDVWPLLDGDDDSGADPERGEVEGSAEPSSCCGWCPCSRRHQPSTAYSSLGRDSSMIDDESSMPEPLPEPGPEPQPQPQPRPQREPEPEPEPEPKRRAPHRVSTGLSAEDKAARQVAAAEAARKRRQEKNLRRRGTGRGAAAPSPEPEEVEAAPAAAAGTGRGPAARSSRGGERGEGQEAGEGGGGGGGAEAEGGGGAEAVGRNGACSNYRLDMSAAEFGACVCGYPKMEHEEFRATKLASPTMRKARV